eukprot:TRINITY_DN1673_c0_g2_i2.p1 TRINITY_DN1673_c0_g2~~TRINITY_DN1673_c0_g2_i2.p1  ORF type:complete len:2153 (+),score=424.13 TRINITY_DN1673_c0_g2_i2:1516-7974(+)
MADGLTKCCDFASKATDCVLGTSFTQGFDHNIQLLAEVSKGRDPRVRYISYSAESCRIFGLPFVAMFKMKPGVSMVAKLESPKDLLEKPICLAVVSKELGIENPVLDGFLSQLKLNRYAVEVDTEGKNPSGTPNTRLTIRGDDLEMTWACVRDRRLFLLKGGIDSDTLLKAVGVTGIPVKIVLERLLWTSGAVSGDTSSPPLLVEDAEKDLWAREGDELAFDVTVSLNSNILFDCLQISGRELRANIYKKDNNWRVVCSLDGFSVQQNFRSARSKSTLEITNTSICLTCSLGLAAEEKPDEPYIVLTGTIEGIWTPTTLAARLSVDADPNVGFQLSAIAPNVPVVKHLTLFSIKADLSFVLEHPYGVSIYLEARIGTKWADGPKLDLEGAVRISKLGPRMVYVHARELGASSLVRLITGCSYNKVAWLDKIFPVWRKVGFLAKYDELAVDSLPGQRMRGSNGNIVVEAIQHATQRTGAPLVKAGELGFAAGAELSWLGLDAKAYCAAFAGVGGAKLALLLSIKPCVLEVAGVKLLELRGAGGPNENLTTELMVNTETRSASFDLSVGVVLFPGILSSDMKARLQFRYGDIPAGSCVKGTKRSCGHLFVTIAVELFGNGELRIREDGTVSSSSEKSILMQGTLRVSFGSSVPSVKALVRIAAMNKGSDKVGIVGILMENLKKAINGIFDNTKMALQNARDKIANARKIPFFFRIIVELILAVAQALVWAFDKAINIITTIISSLAKHLLDIIELRIGGEVSGKNGVVVEVFFHIKVFSFDLKGGLRLNLKSLIMDLCKKLAQFVVGCSDRKAKVANDSRSMDSDFYRTEDDYSDDEGDSLKDKEDATMFPSSLIDWDLESVKLTPEEYEANRAEMMRLKELIEDTKKQLDRVETVPDDDCPQTTFTDPTFDDPPTRPDKVLCRYCRKEFTARDLRKHELACASRTKVICHKCCKLVILKGHECQNDAKVTCPHCKDPVDNLEQHYPECNGDARCTKCSAGMKRMDLDKHLVNECEKGKDFKLCEICKLAYSAGTPHTCPAERTCVDCFATLQAKDFEQHKCVANAIQCPHHRCLAKIPCDELQEHEEKVCTKVPMTCEYCKRSIGITGHAPPVRRQMHLEKQCSKRPRPCHMCYKLLETHDERHRHVQLCPERGTQCHAPVGSGHCDKKLPTDKFNDGVNDAVCPYCAVKFADVHTMKDHLADECEEFKVCCPLRCTTPAFPLHTLARHMEECDRHIYTCWGCNNEVPMDMFFKHLKSCVKLPCAACADEKVLYKLKDGPDDDLEGVKLATHLDHCPAPERRGVTCPYCKEEDVASLEHHLEMRCPSFLVHCPIGQAREESGACDDEVCLKDLMGHLLECRSARFPCPREGCDTWELMTASQTLEHLASECEHFTVTCPFRDCAKDFCKKDEARHFREYHSSRSEGSPPTAYAGYTVGADFARFTTMAKHRLTSTNAVVRTLAHVALLNEDLEQQDRIAEYFECPHCGAAVDLDEQDAHLSWDCPVFVCKCPLGCGHEAPACYKLEHMQDQCVLARGSCQACRFPEPDPELLPHSLLHPTEVDLRPAETPHARDIAAAVRSVLEYDIESAAPDIWQLLFNCARGSDDFSGALRSLYAQFYKELRVAIRATTKTVRMPKRDEVQHGFSCVHVGTRCLYCCDKMSHEDLQLHMESCSSGLSSMKCCYCDKVVERRGLVRHWVQECRGERFLVPCPLGCKEEKLRMCDLSQHHFVECTKATVVCPLCSSEVHATDITKHFVQDCDVPNWCVPCPSCKDNVRPRDLVTNVHYARSCPKMMGVCPVELADKDAKGRPTVIALKGIVDHCIPKAGAHDTERCPNMITPCPAPGCTVKVHRRYLPHHMLHECDHYLIPCENAQYGCEEGTPGEDGQKLVKAKHYHGAECEAFPIECPKCSSLVAQNRQEEHKRIECHGAKKRCRRCGYVETPRLVEKHFYRNCRNVRVHRARPKHSSPQNSPHTLAPCHDKIEMNHWGSAKYTAGQKWGAVFTVGISLLSQEKVMTCCGRDENKPCSYGTCGTCKKRFKEGETVDPVCGPGSSRRFCKTCAEQGTESEMKRGSCRRGCITCSTPESLYDTIPCTGYQCTDCFRTGDELKGTGCIEATPADVNSDPVLKRSMELGYYSVPVQEPDVEDYEQ